MQNESNKQPTLEQLVQFLARCTRDHFQRTSRSIQGSFLANMLKHEFPGFDYSTVGLTKLGDLVRVAEDRGLVRRNPQVHHLELTPVLPAPPALVSPMRGNLSDELLFVVPDVWRAVVLGSPTSRTFFNLTTNAVTEIAADSPKLRDIAGDASLVEIERIDQETQLHWLKEFLGSRGRSEAHDDARVAELLRGEIYALGSVLAQDWKFLRSRRVVEHVRRWAERHSIDPSVVLVPPRKAQPRIPPASTVAASPASDAAIRRAVLAIVHEMTLAELETLSLPLRHVLRHFTVK